MDNRALGVTPMSETAEQAIVPRDAVLGFAVTMERQLRKHDSQRGPDGWVGEDPLFLLSRLKEELFELDRVMNDWDGSEPLERMERARLEAADVANFAMMIAETTHEHGSDSVAGYDLHQRITAVREPVSNRA